MICHKFAFEPIQPNFLKVSTPLDFLSKANTGKSFIPYRQFTTETLNKIAPGERLSKFWENNVAKGPSGSWERNNNGSIKGRPSFGHSRLPTNKPGAAVVGYGFVHPTKPRWLSTEEMQVLSGFSPDYHFTPLAAPARASEIARGVCPTVGEWIAKSVVKSLAEKRRAKLSVTLYDLRKPGIEPMDLTNEYQST